MGKRSKTKINILLCGVLLIGVVLQPNYVWAKNDKSLLEEAFNGNGAKYDPYLISTYDDLCLLRDLVDSGNGLNGKFFLQTSDIEMPENETWNGIGELLEGKAFGGYYNGSGYTISNLNCNEQYAGLFSFLAGEVWNVGIESGTLCGDCVGGITSHGTDKAKIINCYNKASIMATARGGGIADNCPAAIMHCWSLGDVSCTTDAGITAGITSFGDADIVGCYSINTKLIDQTTFTGTINDSSEICAVTEEVFNEYYSDLWNDYLNDTADEYSVDKILENIKRGNSVSENEKNDVLPDVEINRENIVFMINCGGEVCFDKAYEPDLFKQEKEKNKEDFLSLYEQRYSFEGTGTEKDPFQISSYEDLCRFRDCINIKVSYIGYYFILTDDIYCPEGENWIPAGHPILGLGFKGTLDGKGHSIHGIQCESAFAGVFGYLQGTVRNLGIESGFFRGDTVGSITSHAGTDAEIINCYNKADVKGIYRAGGISDNNYGLILNCYNLGTVSKLNEDAVIAGICSYGGAEIEFSYSTTGEKIVDSTTFNGTVEASNVIDASEINRKLESGYQEIHNYIGKNADSVIYMRTSDENLHFDLNLKMTDITDCFEKMPYISLLLCTVFFLIFAFYKLIRLGNKRQGENIVRGNYAKNHVTYQVMRNHIISIALTLTIFIICFYNITEVLKIQTDSGTINLNYWEEDENEKTDVVFLGSSTISCNIDLEELWREYGIAGFCIGAGGLLNDGAYYRLIEAAKSHPIKAVVLDARGCVYDSEYNMIGMNNYIYAPQWVSGLRLSINKIHMINSIIKPKERLYYCLDFPLYHDRYKELSRQDFTHESSLEMKNKGSWTVLYGSQGNSALINSNDITQYLAIDEKSEYYLRKIIEFCKANHIEIIVIKTPYADSEIYGEIYNTVELITQEYGVPYLDFNKHNQEIGLVNSDFWDQTHLNVVGARKCSDFLGEYLTANYNLESHNGDMGYESWDSYSANREDLYLRKITQIDEYFDELERDEKKAVAIPFRISRIKSDLCKDIEAQLRSLDIEIKEISAISDVSAGQNEVGESILFNTNQIEIVNNYQNLTITIEGDKEIKVSSPGWILLVYDDVNNMIADIAFFDSSKAFGISHLY